MFERELALHRRVPLLDVAGAEVAVDREHALPEAGVRRQRNRLDARVRSASTNAGVMLSSVRCDTVCRNGNDRRRERRRDAGHLDPDQAVAGARHRLVGDAADDAEPRAEVELVQLPRGARLAVAPEVLELLRSRD